MLNKELKLKILKGLLVPDAVETEGSAQATGLLPKPIADEMIKVIEETNYMRKIFRTIKVPARTLTIPTVTLDYSGVLQAKTGYAPSGLSNTAPSVGSILLEPGKLAAKGALQIDDINDSSVDVIDLLLQNFAIAFGRAEERAMLLGAERDRTKTALLSIFLGLYTIAADHSTTTAVTYNPSTAYAVADCLSSAIKELGVYGRNKGELVLIASPDFCDYMRRDKSLRDNMYGSAEVIRKGELPKVFGIEILETTYLDGQGQGSNKACAILIPKAEAIIGDRRQFKVTPDADPASDAMNYYAYESVDFRLQHMTSSTYDAIVLIDQAS